MNDGKVIKYAWEHLPTGKRGIKAQRFLDDHDYVEKLDKWNRIHNSYRYYSEHSKGFSEIEEVVAKQEKQ